LAQAEESPHSGGSTSQMAGHGVSSETFHSLEVEGTVRRRGVRSYVKLMLSVTALVTVAWFLAPLSKSDYAAGALLGAPTAQIRTATSAPRGAPAAMANTGSTPRGTPPAMAATAQSVETAVDVKAAAAILSAAQTCEHALEHAEEAAAAVVKATESIAHTAAVAASMKETDVAAFLVQKVATAKLAAETMVDRAARATRFAGSRGAWQSSEAADEAASAGSMARAIEETMTAMGAAAKTVPESWCLVDYGTSVHICAAAEEANAAAQSAVEKCGIAQGDLSAASAAMADVTDLLEQGSTTK